MAQHVGGQSMAKLVRSRRWGVDAGRSSFGPPAKALYIAAMSDNPDATVDFGFRSVPLAEKTGLVRAVFDSVAPNYDRMNDLMSLGVHRMWKQIFVSDLTWRVLPSPLTKHDFRPQQMHWPSPYRSQPSHAN